MIIGYARTSTIDQTAGFEPQLRELEGVKSQKIFREQTSLVGIRPSPAQEFVSFPSSVST
jgi:DNA invertase Pin-like site-specific DNA recombinase